jgi:hypothetical protein
LLPLRKRSAPKKFQAQSSGRRGTLPPIAGLKAAFEDGKQP